MSVHIKNHNLTSYGVAPCPGLQYEIASLAAEADTEINASALFRTVGKTKFWAQEAKSNSAQKIVIETRIQFCYFWSKSPVGQIVPVDSRIHKSLLMNVIYVILLKSQNDYLQRQAGCMRL